jgi:hypothetical protein
MARFKATRACEVKLDDVMMQVDEHKRKTIYDYYRAHSIFSGELVTPITNLEGVLVGQRVEYGVEIVWKSLGELKDFTMRYHPNAILDIADSPVADVSDLIKTEQHEEE